MPYICRVKPSEFTPLTLLRIAELAVEAGVPAGAFNVVNGRGQAGQMLIEHPEVAKVAFTGSVPTGIAVGKAAMAAKAFAAGIQGIKEDTKTWEGPRG